MKLSQTLGLKALVLIVLLISSFVLLEGQTATLPEIGNGSVETPYIINNLENLYWIAATDEVVPSPNRVTRWSSHYKQTANIDASPTSGWFGGEGWLPIGTQSNPFQGHYDGDIFVISNLTINRPTNHWQALFGYTKNAVFENIGLKDVDIVGGNFTAALIGSIPSHTRVEGCFVTGIVNGENYVAGLIGYMTGIAPVSRITDCYSTATVISRSTSVSHYIGGIVGYIMHGDVQRNYVTGPVYPNVETSNGGALIGGSGDGTGTISDNYRNTETTQMTTGGTGTTARTTTQMLQAANFDGFNFETVWSIDAGTSYPYLQWEGDEAGEHNIPAFLPPRSLTASGFVGGYVDLSWTAPPADFGVPNGYNIYRMGNLVNEGFLIQEPQYQDIALEDWTTYSYYVTAVYEEAVESNHTNIAVVTTTRFAGGNGTEEDPFLVWTAEQLYGIRYTLSAHYHYKQIADISIAHYNPWIAIGDVNNRFTGSFDGDQWVISGLTYSDGSYGGLFGYLDGATLKRISLVDVNITGTGAYSGVLAGFARDSIIRNCNVSGSVVSNSNNVGGFIGYITGVTLVIDCWNCVTFRSTGGQSSGFIGVNSGATIRNCFSFGNTESTASNGQDIGGLVGLNSGGTVTNSYSRATVTVPVGASRIGGLIGNNTGTVSNCYATGRISDGETKFGGLIGYNSGNVTYSYWDTETSGQLTSAVGEGRTTEEMTYPYDPNDPNTFVDWDFDDIWSVDDDYTVNDGYPYLQWQYNLQWHYYENPVAAIEPSPEHEATNVSDDLEYISWSYKGRICYGIPVGFRVYFDYVEEFIDDDYWWEDYVEGEENYSTNILEAFGVELIKDATYFWKVVPTTRAGGSGDGLDAIDCSLWRFHTEYEVEGELDPPDEPTGHYITTKGNIEVVFIPNAGEVEITSITFVVSSNSNLNPVQRFSNNNVLGKYYEFRVEYSGVFINGMSIQLTFNKKPNQIWVMVGEGNWTPIDDNRITWDEEDVEQLKPIISLVGLWEGRFRSGIFRFAGDNGEEGATLPVELSSFTASITANSFVEIKWVSETETNMLGYNIYRSTIDKLNDAVVVNPVIIRATNTSQTQDYLFIDEDVIPGSSYYYWLQSNGLDLTSSFYGPVYIELSDEGEDGNVPEIEPVTQLIGAYPNPFNPGTNIIFSLSNKEFVTINLFNMKGQLLKTLVDNTEYDKGANHSVYWDGKDITGREVSSGIYLYHFKAGNYEQAKKVLLVK